MDLTMLCAFDLNDRKGQKQMNSNSSVELTKIAKSMELKNLTPDVDISSIVVTTPDINRPALQLTGYFEHFASERVQIVGYVEFTYLEHMTRNQRVHAYEQFCAHKVPCIIFTSKTDPDEDILRIATENGIPVFTTEKNTSPFMAEIIRWLNVELAPCISIHGVLVDVYGEGVLIMGESGIGKSEAALELHDAEVLRLKEKTEHIIKALDSKLSFHDFRLVKTTPVNLIFDLLVPAEYTQKDTDRVLHQLMQLISEMEAGATCVITVDHSFEAPEE